MLVTTVTFVNMPSVRCEQEVCNLCKLHAIIDDVDCLELADGVDLSLSLFDKPFKNEHPSHGENHQSRSLESQIC